MIIYLIGLLKVKELIFRTCLYCYKTPLIQSMIAVLRVGWLGLEVGSKGPAAADWLVFGYFDRWKLLHDSSHFLLSQCQPWRANPSRCSDSLSTPWTTHVLHWQVGYICLFHGSINSFLLLLRFHLAYEVHLILLERLSSKILQLADPHPNLLRSILIINQVVRRW